ncbi:hypothetical protein NNO_0056 [Hydrogenimonas sp.]|nr:hypothetical protein NNO_0056 [Hydrogenimonas sp.]
MSGWYMAVTGLCSLAFSAAALVLNHSHVAVPPLAVPLQGH